MSNRAEQCDDSMGGGQTVRQTHDWGGPDPVVVPITDAVETLTDRAATDLEPLYDVVDPKAIEQLLSRGDADCQLTFSYAGCAVTVDGTGDIVVTHQH